MVGVGAFDAHMGAVGAGVREYQLAKVMGTSTCDILVAPSDKGGDDDTGATLVRGICGQVDGSVVPGLTGYEAGQSAFGDVYAWFRDLLVWPLKTLAAKETWPVPGVAAADLGKLVSSLSDAVIPILDAEAEKVDPAESGVVALDWLNGRRTPDADQNLRGAITGLHLGTDAPRIYRALIEATAFGARAITDRFSSQNVPIQSVIALGGVAVKAALVMQITADVLNMEISVSAAEQACALGAATFAAVAAGIYPGVKDAQERMGAGFSRVYTPNPDMVRRYESIYRRYCRIGKWEEQLSLLRRET
jgi:L-ribulokinase